MSSKPKKSYEVGRNKPPKAAQFKKGQSGNPRGRPKGALNKNTVVARILAEQIPVTENGERRVITKFEAIVKAIVHRAIGGDARAGEQVLRMASVLEEGPEATASKEVLGEADEAVMANLAARLQRQYQTAVHEGVEDETHE